MKIREIKELLEFRFADRGADSAPKRPDRNSETATSGNADQDETPPRRRSQVMQLMDELDRLKCELNNANERVVELEAIADEDPLVPVLNRRGFLRELERTLAYVTRYKTRVSLIYCDLDDFKVVNDHHGHAAGDAALQFFAEFLVNSVRRSDLVGRMGGDEFAIVLHQADEAAALEKASRLIGDLAGRRFVHKGRTITLALSAGVTELRTNDTVVDVLERADNAMFDCKGLNKKNSATAAMPAE